MILVDMDGVVADFDKGIMELYGASMESLNWKIKGKFWNTDCASIDFYANLDPIPAGVELVNHLKEKKIEFSFCTSCGGGSHHNNIAQQKLTWLKKQGWGKQEIIFCNGTKSKSKFAHVGTLIDDRKKVVDAFEKAGGKAILFKPEHIFELKNSL